MLIPLCRYSQRCILIPFDGPKIGPTNPTESEDFNSLSGQLEAVGSCAGFAVCLGHDFVTVGIHVIQHDIEPEVRKLLPASDPRTERAFATLLYFANQVM